MTTFIRLLKEANKEAKLREVVWRERNNHGNSDPLQEDADVFVRDCFSFRDIPGAAFAYWASDNILDIFRTNENLKSAGRVVRTTNPSTDDFRFARAWWEPIKEFGSRWRSWNKGGGYSPFYRDIDLVIDWDSKRSTYRGYTGTVYRPDFRPANLEYFSRPGLTWLYRGSRLCVQEMPEDTVISTRGNGIYSEEQSLKSDLALLNSSAADYLIKLTLGRSGHPQFDIGDLNSLPVPEISDDNRRALIQLGEAAWSLMRSFDTVSEISHAFLLPTALRSRLGDFDLRSMSLEFFGIRKAIDDIAFELYGFDDSDRNAALASSGAEIVHSKIETEVDEDAEDEGKASTIDETDGLLSWAVGVAFGRFDWRLATGERPAPQEPRPFDPLPPKSPGMLSDCTEPFHTHAGILVDDSGHKHDLAHLIEEVLARVNAPAPPDVRRWLQRKFFPFHLQNYSKSRRKAPIYWPLSTASGTYTLWVYYPSLTGQTLYTAVNDFLEGPSGKLNQVEQEGASLRAKSVRSRDEDKKLEALQDLAAELIDLRDSLLRIAPTYHPNHDDGVQITAAPLWPLFRYRPWQKVLKDTWAKLEKGDFHWARLAMAYWPDRVREKCITDKSLAIAHDLETLYVEPEQKAAKPRGRKKGGET